MTREEIEELKGLAASMGLYDDKNPCKRAVILGKAIKALEQESCGDAVSRQAVLDLVDGYSESRSNVEDVTQDIISDIVALPPINPRKCDNCEVGNPCLYCKHKFEQRERNDKK